MRSFSPVWTFIRLYTLRLICTTTDEKKNLGVVQVYCGLLPLKMKQIQSTSKNESINKYLM